MQNDVQSFLELATPGVSKLHPYQAGKPIDELKREYGINDIIKLASNENPLGPSPKALDAVKREMSTLALYPDGNGFDLKQALAQKHGVNLKQITLGNGSSDALDFIIRAIVTPADEVVFSRHSFALYPILTQMAGAQAVVTPAKDWGHDLSLMLKAITAKTKIVFIANPNNPTGTWLTATELQSFLNEVPKHVVVVIDEAYHEYVEETAYQSAVEWLPRYPNLMVTRTFSKAYGLAGLRVGYALSNAAVADLMNRVRPPFNVNTLALKAAEVALRDEQHISKSIELNREGMKQICQAFDRQGIEYIPSVGNFLSFKVSLPEKDVYEGLLKAGVIIRPIGNYEMPGFLRVTIGSQQENARFLNSLNKLLGG